MKTKNNMVLACIVALSIVVMSAGCSSMSTKPLDQRVPQSVLKSSDGKRMIYLTDTQSIPTPILEQSLELLALMAANMETNDTGIVAIPKSIPVDIVMGLVNNALGLAPQLNEQYLESRRVAATVSREAIIIGFDDKEEAEEVYKLLKVWTDSYNRSIINNHHQ